jgi:hypothetical protein
LLRRWGDDETIADVRLVRALRLLTSGLLNELIQIVDPQLLLYGAELVQPLLKPLVAKEPIPLLLERWPNSLSCAAGTILERFAIACTAPGFPLARE